ncbi:hypothetical protein NECAME_00482 [Necator americanus]|uniref:Uncharacterized protein n=1 Tax=Necator americanus TaxID=51031 RepID=W2T7I4_NECAM|nr:hypothetical protein NECAME_00482 [Necator americanus]ETN76957.1 hypothetical protein NECAME_00482 [Necator americanus]
MALHRGQDEEKKGGSTNLSTWLVAPIPLDLWCCNSAAEYSSEECILKKEDSKHTEFGSIC